MGWRILSRHTPKSRNTHRCIWCGQAIENGEKHTLEKGIMDGKFQANRYHQECHVAMEAWTKDNDADDGFMAYCNERPIKEEA